MKINRLISNLLALLILGNCFAVPPGWAETTIPSETSRDMNAALDKTVAKELLDQLYLSVEELQNGPNKVAAIIGLARGYNQLSEHARATELMFQAFEIARENPLEPGLTNSILKAAEAISDDAAAYDLFIQTLEVASTIESEYRKAHSLIDVAFYGTERFGTDHLANDLIHQARLAITELPTGKDKAEVLFLLARLSYQQQKDSLALELLHQSLNTLASISDDNRKMDLLLQLLDVSEQLSDDVIGEDVVFDGSLLAHVLTVADTMQTELYQAYIWSDSIALAERSVREKVPELLQQSLQVFNAQVQDNEIANSDPNEPISLLFSSITVSYSLLPEEYHSQEFTQQLIQAAHNLPDDRYRPSALVGTAEIAPLPINGEVSQDNIQQVLTLANTVDDSWTQSHMLIALAKEHISVNPQDAYSLISQAIAALDANQSNYGNNGLFVDVVKAIKQFPEEEAQSLLEQSLTKLKQVEDEDFLYLLSLMVNEYGNEYEREISSLLEISLKETILRLDKARQAHSFYVVFDYLNKFNGSGEFSDEITYDLLRQVLTNTEGLEEFLVDGGFFRRFTTVALHLNDERYINALIEQLIGVSTRFDSPSFEMQVSIGIAALQASLSNQAEAKAWLDRALTAGQRIEDEFEQITTIFSMAQVLTLMPPGEIGIQEWLDDWFAMTANAQKSSAKKWGLSAIAQAAQGLSDAQTIRSVVDKVTALSKQLDEPEQASVLADMAETLGKLGSTSGSI